MAKRTRLSRAVQHQAFLGKNRWCTAPRHDAGVVGICGELATNAAYVTPPELGGTEEWRNLQPRCKRCLIAAHEQNHAY